ncbi:MAG: lipopolysaccharide heptosyltransferase II [Chlamydiales bacterium]|nr:lipopolysaccharide heptosyltransferase II [Chlamydiales bacterium]
MQSLENLDPRNVIVRMPNWIGDLVMATPILADIKKRFPRAQLTAMCRSPICDLLRDDSHIDNLFVFSKSEGAKGLKQKKQIIQKLRAGNYDLGILLTHSLSSAWWFWQGGVANRLGYDGSFRKLFLTESLPFPENLQSQHLVITYKMLLKPLGISVSDTAPRLYLSEQEILSAKELLKGKGIPNGAKILGVNPGATYGSAKCWLPERFKEVVQRLLRDLDLHVVFFGDQATASLVGEICEGLGSRVVNLAGATSLRTFASIVSLCDLLLTNDSGPMHVADAVETPIVALFGSTSEIVTGPYRQGKVIHKHVECSPCYQRRCPIDFRCMKRIESDEVYQALAQALGYKHSKLEVRAF